MGPGRPTTRELTVVLEGFSFLECPRWRDGRLWMSDFYPEKVVTTDGRGGTEVVAEVPGQPSGLGFLPDGRALVVSMRAPSFPEHERRPVREAQLLAVRVDVPHAGLP